MPPVIFAVPIAAALAWLAMRMGGPKRTSGRVPMTAGAGLEGGDTQRLHGSSRDDPWKRDELPFASGGEVGGPYGPASNAEAPNAPGGYEAPPGPTQTVLMGPETQYALGPAAKAALGYNAPAPSSPVYSPPAAPAPVYHGAAAQATLGTQPPPPPPMPAGRYV